MWIAVPLLGSPRLTALAALAAVLALCAWSHRRQGSSWGFRAEALGPAARRAAMLTLPAVALILGAGMGLGSLHTPGHLAPRFAVLVLWALLQQFILQTVILREAKSALPRQGAPVPPRGLFAPAAAFDPAVTGGMRVGYGYFLHHGSWS